MAERPTLLSSSERGDENMRPPDRGTSRASGGVLGGLVDEADPRVTRDSKLDAGGGHSGRGACGGEAHLDMIAPSKRPSSVRPTAKRRAARSTLDTRKAVEAVESKYNLSRQLPATAGAAVASHY